MKKGINVIKEKSNSDKISKLISENKYYTHHEYPKNITDVVSEEKTWVSIFQNARIPCKYNDIVRIGMNFLQEDSKYLFHSVNFENLCTCFKNCTYTKNGKESKIEGIIISILNTLYSHYYVDGNLKHNAIKYLHNYFKSCLLEDVKVGCRIFYVFNRLPTNLLLSFFANDGIVYTKHSYCGGIEYNFENKYAFPWFNFILDNNIGLKSKHSIPLDEVVNICKNIFKKSIMSSVVLFKFINYANCGRLNWMHHIELDEIMHFDGLVKYEEEFTKYLIHQKITNIELIDCILSSILYNYEHLSDKSFEFTFELLASFILNACDGNCEELTDLIGNKIALVEDIVVDKSHCLANKVLEMLMLLKYKFRLCLSSNSIKKIINMKNERITLAYIKAGFKHNHREILLEKSLSEITYKLVKNQIDSSYKPLLEILKISTKIHIYPIVDIISVYLKNLRFL